MFILTGFVGVAADFYGVSAKILFDYFMPLS